MSLSVLIFRVMRFCFSTALTHRPPKEARPHHLGDCCFLGAAAVAGYWHLCCVCFGCWSVPLNQYHNHFQITYLCVCPKSAAQFHLRQEQPLCLADRFFWGFFFIVVVCLFCFEFFLFRIFLVCSRRSMHFPRKGVPLHVCDLIYLLP